MTALRQAAEMALEYLTYGPCAHYVKCQDMISTLREASCTKSQIPRIGTQQPAEPSSLLLRRLGRISKELGMIDLHKETLTQKNTIALDALNILKAAVEKSASTQTCTAWAIFVYGDPSQEWLFHSAHWSRERARFFARSLNSKTRVLKITCHWSPK